VAVTPNPPCLAGNGEPCTAVRTTLASVALGSDALTESHRITVDYDRRLAEMIDAGGYDWVDPQLTAENFSLDGSGKQDREAILVTFGAEMTPDVAGQTIVGMDLRPARVEELLALGEQHPESMKMAVIVALGSSISHAVHGGTVLPDIFNFPDERKLRLMTHSSASSSTVYLAIRE
jgi:hypothetical protein